MHYEKAKKEKTLKNDWHIRFLREVLRQVRNTDRNPCRIRSRAVVRHNKKMKPITLKINVSRIDKTHLHQGEKGKYLDLVLFPNKTGPDKNGNTHIVMQSISKEQRDAGVKGAILGNACIPFARTVEPEHDKPSMNINSPGDDDVPF